MVIEQAILEGMKSLNIKEIPEEVIQRFKAYCNLQGKSMQEVIVDFMRERGELVQLKK